MKITKYTKAVSQVHKFISGENGCADIFFELGGKTYSTFDVLEEMAVGIEVLEKALDIIIEIFTECDFGYDNLGNDILDKYKDIYNNVGYNEGIKLIAIEMARDEIEK